MVEILDAKYKEGKKYLSFKSYVQGPWDQDDRAGGS